MNSNYWEDSILRGPATEHVFVTAQRPGHECAICGLLHKTAE